MKNKNEKIVTREENFAEWFTSIINSAKLIQYVDVKGFMIFQPYGWNIWENIKNILDKQFQEIGIKNMYVPLLIPLSEFEKEKEHVEGFAPELYLVSSIGQKKLDDPLAIRPTSEIMFCKYFQNVIKSYKDLPVKVNQWTSVLRAEKNTRPFLRNSEFHWHETHCSFQTFEEANDFSLKFLNIYANFCENELCIPVIKGRKTEGEKFAGADISYTIESMMQDGQALQSATSHMLGQGFCKSYGIQYQSKDNTLEYPFNTSHGLTTRIIGAVIMVHADDNGLVLPVSIAPIQIKILPIFWDKNPKVLSTCEELLTKLKTNYRCEIDMSGKNFGYMQSECEVQGVPLSIVVGPNDITNKTITLIRRDNSEKKVVSIDLLEQTIVSELEQYKENLYKKAYNRLHSSIIDISNISEMENILNSKKWVRAFFDGSIEDEKKIKELTGATPRCIVENTSIGKCIMTGKETNKLVIFARAY